MTTTTTATAIDGWTSSGCGDDEASPDALAMQLEGPTALERFSVAYQSLHGYLSIAVCAVGILLNATRSRRKLPVDPLEWQSIS